VWRQRNGKVCFLIKLTGVDAFDRACCPFVPLKDLEAHIISALLTDAYWTFVSFFLKWLFAATPAEVRPNNNTCVIIDQMSSILLQTLFSSYERSPVSEN